MKTSTILIGSTAILSAGVLVYFLTKPKKHPDAENYGNKRLSKDASPESQGTKGVTVVTEPDWNNPFDMLYAEDVSRWITPKKPLVMGMDKASVLAEKLKKARGACWICNDNEESVHQVFAKELKSKVDVALLSRAFWNKNKSDLWKHLSTFLDSDEMETYVHGPVRKLPKYIL